MARLSSLVGGILAELVRARVVADELTRQLVEEYDSDPVLASMSVPRISMKEIGLTLRFSVDDVEEIEPPEPEPESVRKEWLATLPKRLDSMLGSEAALDKEERKLLHGVLAKTAAGSIPAPLLKEALKGKADRVATAAVKPALDGWNRLPAPLRKKLGNKAGFSKRLGELAASDFQAWLKKKRSRAFVEAALASSVKVAVQRGQLPADPAQQQEIQLTLSGEDLELVIEKPDNGEA